jgi:hypothetical protein
MKNLRRLARDQPRSVDQSTAAPPFDDHVTIALLL